MGFSPIAQSWTIPLPPLILMKIMPLLNLVAANVADWVHLIKYVYLHDEKTWYVCCMP